MVARVGENGVNVGKYQGPTESSGLQNGPSGKAGDAPQYALPAAGQTSASNTPSFDLKKAAAILKAAREKAEENKRRSKDKAIASESLRDTSDWRLHDGSSDTKDSPDTKGTQTEAKPGKTESGKTESADTSMLSYWTMLKERNEAAQASNGQKPGELDPGIERNIGDDAAHSQTYEVDNKKKIKNTAKAWKASKADYFATQQSIDKKNDPFEKEKKAKKEKEKKEKAEKEEAERKERKRQKASKRKHGKRIVEKGVSEDGKERVPRILPNGEIVMGIPVTPEGEVDPDLESGYFQTGIIPYRAEETSIAPADKKKKLDGSSIPRVVIGPRFNGLPMGDGSPEPSLLPGSIGGYDYAIPPDLLEDDKKSDRDIIDEYVKQQAEEAPIGQFYPNAVGSSLEYATPEQFQKDYEEGRRERGRYDNENVVSRAKRRMNEARDRIIQWYHEAYVPLESEHVSEDGHIRYSDVVENAIAMYMNHMGFAPQERYVVMQQVIKAIGLSPDRNGVFFNGDEREKIPDDIFIEALNNMMVSCEIYGHPYALVNEGMVLAGTRCYPIGVMTLHEAEILCSTGHRFEGTDPYELISKTAETWVNDTLPDIRRNVYRQENGEAQMLVIEDMVRAMCSLDNISPHLYGVGNEVDRGYDEMMAETTPGYRMNETSSDIETMDMRRRQLDLAKRRRERAAKRLDRQRNRTYQIYDEDVLNGNGEIVHARGDRVDRKDEDNLGSIRTKYVRNPKANAFDSVCASVANMAKFSGVVGYVPIIASGVIEHAQGNVNAKIANGILFGGNDRYQPSDAMYAYVTSPAGVEAIAASKALLHVGGQDALMLFRKEYKVLNKANAQKFIDDFVKREGSKALVPRKAKEIMSKAEEATSWLMPGDIGFGKADARRWLEGFMLNNMFNANEGNSMIADKANEHGVSALDPLRGDSSKLEQSFTSREVLEMMDAMGVERFLAAAMEMNAGRDAILMMRNQTLDRISPITYIIDSILRRSGVTNMFVTLGIDTYFTYGLNLVQMMIPFSNTFSYLMTKGINMLATGGRNNTDQLDLNILNYQMGGNDSFGVGLRKNIIYDVVKLGNITVISAFMYFVILALGFEEPEDESLKYVWSEYKIGKNVNLGGGDDEGNPTGIPVYAAWWLNDLTLFGMPMAYALHASKIEQKLGDNDPDLGVKLFFSGCHDMLSGCSLLDLIKCVNNAYSDFEYYEQMMQDPDMECPPDWISFGALQAELWCARGVNKFVPNALKSLRTDTLIVGEDALDHTAYKVYDRDSETDGKTEYVQDWFEIQRRIESKYNPIYALYNNLTKNGYLLDDGTTEKTGYLFDEMPISTAKDPLRTYWAHKYDYDPDNIPGGEDNRIAYTESLMDQVIEDIDSFSSPEEAAAQGYMIPAALRYKMRDYCYQHINFEENVFNEKLQAGWLASADYQAAKTEMRNNQQYWYNILNNWVFSEDIPWTDEGYAKLITSSQDVYYYKDSGKPCTKFDYWQLGPETVEQRYIPRGDHPTSFIPFTTPDSRGRGYNFETISNWYKDGESGSDLDAIFNQMEKEQAVVPYGRDAGVYVNTAIFGGNPNFKTDELVSSSGYNSRNEPTMGYRAYVPWDDSFLDDLRNVTRKDVDGESSMGDMGKYKSSSTWSSSTYPSYYSRSAGWYSSGKRRYSSGSSYNPKIYATKVYATHADSTHTNSTRTSIYSRSVNSDKAATMYAKTPSSTHVNSYLRPSFSTKGSREAYKRQDI